LCGTSRRAAMPTPASRDVAQKTYELGRPSAYVKIRMCVRATAPSVPRACERASLRRGRDID
jgi:hypothetical protein